MLEPRTPPVHLAQTGDERVDPGCLLGPGGERNVRERPQLSESTIATVLHAARRCAMDANPDAQVRLARLDEQIAALQAERDRVADGGEIEVASDARRLERLSNLSRLLADLPADFLAAAEAIDDIHRELADAFRADDRRGATVTTVSTRSRRCSSTGWLM